MANNYEIDYTDKRFTQVEQDKQTALSELEETYAGMIDKSDKYYKDQVKATEQWGEEQTQRQNEQTEFAIQKIEQQKAQAKSDYIKEQTGAYVDWRKQSNEYGAEAEKMAASGLQNTGFSESSQVSMYNAYQNRVATALESFNRIVTDFDNSMTESRLQNSTILAEIAFQTQEKMLQLNLEGFQYKNQLLLDKANKKTEINNTYYNRYQDVLAQINHENALAEQIRQYNESLAEERRQYNASLAQQQAELAFEKQKYADQQAAARAAARTKVTEYNGRLYKSSGKESARANAEKIIKSRESNNSSSKDDSATMKSILALGYGPISEAKLASLVKSGVVEQYTSNGVTLFRKSPYAFKQSKLFG